MSKIILEFDRYTEKDEYLDALNGPEYKTVLQRTLQAIRNDLKYRDDTLTAQEKERLERLQALIWNMLDSRSLDLY